MDENQPTPETPEPIAIEEDRARSGALVRLTFYGDKPDSLEKLEESIQRALTAEGFDVNVSRGEWT